MLVRPRGTMKVSLVWLAEPRPAPQFGTSAQGPARTSPALAAAAGGRRAAGLRGAASGAPCGCLRAPCGGELPRGRPAGAQAEDLPPSGPGNRRSRALARVLFRWQVPESADVGTRKMVNYAWRGRSQRKLWWRSEAVLTCKSIVRAGYRGERLIEPSSSWFPPKFPSG